MIERLLAGPAKQKDLIRDLGLKSPSRLLADLMRVHLIAQAREGSHDPYYLVDPARTQDLLSAAAELASSLSQDRAVRALAQAEADRERLKQQAAARTDANREDPGGPAETEQSGR